MKNLLPCMVIFAVIAGLAHLHATVQLQDARRENLADLGNVCQIKAAGLQAGFDRLLDAAGTMAAWVRLDERGPGSYDAAADALLKVFDGIDRVALARDGRISFVFPQPWSDHVFKKNLLTDQARGPASRESFRSGQGIVTGPHDAGGVKQFFSAQVPVLADGQSPAGFQGFALAAITVEKLTQLAGLAELAKDGYEYRLEHLGLAPGEQVRVAGSETPLKDGVSARLSAPGLDMALTLARKDPPPSLLSFWPTYAGGLLLALVLSGLAYAAQRRPARPDALAEVRADRLRRVNRLFAGEIRKGRRVVKELKASSELAKDMFDACPAVMLLVDPFEFSVIDSNPAAERYFGWSRAEMTGMPLSTFNKLPDEELGRNVSQALRSGGLFRARYMLADGSARQVEILSGPLRRGGKVVLQSIVQDVTGWEQARRELRDNRHKLESIFDAADCAIAEIDGQGAIRLVNQGFEDLFGLKREDAPGRSFLDFIHPEQHEKWRGILSDVAGSSQGRVCMLKRFVRADRQEFWGNICVGGLKDQSGSLSAGVAVVTDVTALMEAKKASEAANAAKSRFLANLSHEIRSPMNAIMGLSEITLRTVLDDRQRDNLTKIIEAGKALVKVIEALLDYASLDAGRVELLRSPFELGEVVDSLRARFASKAAAKGLAFRIEMPAKLPGRLEGDPVRLEQVLANLLSNAVKFTKAGEVALRVAVDVLEGGKARLAFTVSDTGKGMDPEQIEGLFQPFAQAETDMSRSAGGPGLGLSVADKLTALMGGTLTATSIRQSGSTFRLVLELPLLAHERGGSRPAFGSTDIKDLAEGMAGRRVLVVDDNPLGRHTAMEMLRLGDVAAEGASGGREALSMMERAQYDAVLLDIQMPGMDGFATMEAMKNLPGGKIPPVIAVTGHARNEDRLRCVEAGMAGHVSKPYSPETLFIALRELVAVEGGGASGPSGLDIQRALKLLMNNTALYGRLLLGFVREYGQAARGMRELMDAGNTEDAVVLAHSIKGLAANLGGERLRMASLALELGLRQNDPEKTGRLVEDFTEELDRFLALAAEHGNKFSSSI